MVQGLNTNYGSPDESGGQKYPAIQVSTYQPRDEDEGQAIPLVLSEDSLSLLGDDWLANCPVETVTCRYGKEREDMVKVPDDIRWVLLGRPRMFAMVKKDKSIHNLQKGMKLKENGMVTATRLLLCAVKDGHLIESSDGSPQLFTLKLTSTKTKLVDGDRKDPSFSNLGSLNTALCKAYKVRNQSLLHLVSVSIQAIATEISNAVDSSMGIIFQFNGGAKALSDADQQRMFMLVQCDEVKEFLNDPFHLAGKGNAEPTNGNSARPPDSAQEDGEEDEVEYDDIPF